MKRDLQHKKILSLREYLPLMKGGDKEAFEMMVKRDRDDEDLDSFALQQLDQLYERYGPKKPRKDLEERWKKLTDG